MIIKMLPVRRSVKGVLDYNENKIFDGHAQLVDVGNLPSADGYTIRSTFERMEANPAISAQTRNKAFHMAFNPGPDDSIDEAGCLACIREIMEELGYGAQPYAVFRHNDIDRGHYHIVSVRVREDGRVIPDNFEGATVGRKGRELGKKYGFTLGAARKKAQDVRRIRRFNPAGTLRDEFAGALLTAGDYDWRSFEEFAAVMRTLGVLVRTAPRKDGGRNLLVLGLDARDRQATRLYSMERAFDTPAYAMVQEQMAANAAILPSPDYPAVRAQVVTAYCLAANSREDTFASMMRSCGLRPVIERTKDGRIEAVRIIDPRAKRVFTASDEPGAAVALEPFRRQERRGALAPLSRKTAGRRSAAASTAQLESIAKMIEEQCRARGVAVPQRRDGTKGTTKTTITKTL